MLSSVFWSGLSAAPSSDGASRGGSVLPRVDEFEAHSGRQQRGGLLGAFPGAFLCGGTGGLGAGLRFWFRVGSAFRPDPDLHTVRRAHPQRCGGAADPARGAFHGLGVGCVVGVVGLDVLPAGPDAGARRAGADLDLAAEFGGGVVPDDADEGEGPYGQRGEAERDGAGDTVGVEGP
ncbi:hypothetical protein SHIRM173S_03755 [Streptomyces hirsutus]